MERWILFCFVCVFMMGFVFAADGDWGDTNVEGVDDVENENVSDNQDVESDSVSPVDYGAVGSNGKGAYTWNFWIALFIGLVALIVVVIFVLFWIRGPIDRWRESKDKSKVSKKKVKTTFIGRMIGMMAKVSEKKPVEKPVVNAEVS